MEATGCLACHARHAPLVRAIELRRPDRHHHHVNKCARCGAAWFSDIVRSPLGVPFPSRRDTLPCSCSPRYLLYAILFTEAPASACRCGVACLAGLAGAA